MESFILHVKEHNPYLQQKFFRACASFYNKPFPSPLQLSIHRKPFAPQNIQNIQNIQIICDKNFGLRKITESFYPQASFSFSFLGSPPFPIIYCQY